ncbi:MAG: alanine dehydrogenase [Planctomycetes bacterium]|nr:alanine dehydrogenase [Planctomycetota bacterium]
MKIGIPSEIKSHEYRVSAPPAAVEILTRRGHEVFVQKGAGEGSGIADDEYTLCGAKVIDSADEVWSRAEMIIKVKEPQANEIPMMREGQVVFTYFHFAASESLTLGCQKSRAICIAYETIQDRQGRLPLLTPMSEVAGRMSIQEGAKYLEKPVQGRGILLAGVPGVSPAHCTIIGGGIVGTHAAKIAAGLGASVTILDINLDRLRYLDDVMPKNVTTLYSDRQTLLAELAKADLVIGAILIPGARAPKLILKEDLKLMKAGSVIVDVAVDQGGCCETTHPTTHDDPVFQVDGVQHYCVANMPGAVGRTSTYALSHATITYARSLADKGWRTAAKEDPGLARGVEMSFGKVHNHALSETFGIECEPLAL